MKSIPTLYYFLILSFLPVLLTAQPKGAWENQSSDAPPTITGKVIEGETQTPLEFATVTLFDANDSTMVSGVITDVDGRFSLEARPGTFYLQVDFIGFQPVIVDDVVLNGSNKTLDLGSITMSAAAEMLEEIEVRAEKSSMQLSLDKKIFNVGKDLANSGGTAAEVLDNVPSVTVDVEGNVELRGAGGVRILVNGNLRG